MLEIKDWSYQDFPEFTEFPSDIPVIKTTGDEIYIEYIPDVVYKEVNGIKLHLQLLIPETRNHPEKNYPCIVHIQGSAWRKQNMYRNLPNLSRLAAHGCVVANVEYRSSDLAAFPAQAEDGRSAIRFLKEQASTYSIDSNRIFVSGDSSGGHTAVFTQIFSCLENDVSSRTKGIIDFYGSVSVMEEDSNPTTLNHHLPESPEGAVMGGADMRANPELREKLSAECNISKEMELPPVLIFHGTKDRTVNPRQSLILYRKLRELGKEVSLYFIQGADHGGAEFWTEEVLANIDNFVK